MPTHCILYQYEGLLWGIKKNVWFPRVITAITTLAQAEQYLQMVRKIEPQRRTMQKKDNVLHGRWTQLPMRHVMKVNYWEKPMLIWEYRALHYFTFCAPT